MLVIYAHAGFNDFSSEQKEVVFDAGSNAVNLTVPITNDYVLEDIEYFYLRLIVPDEMAGLVLLEQDFAKVTIEDDDCEFMIRSTLLQYIAARV